ncbi:PepSY-associated TM helix domain-containing protein [Methylosinus sp. LW3]|uniref:PepSY-associated TM helix domain-containing protein n=1 Tax=Methylosinus sp. LW3 TaxID=107635 RepID=UPI0004667CDB|nr:PepSY-associated TM helix domain-containing protein [Methylosinus sp. LW3]
MIRSIFVFLHRLVGLAMTGFLIVVALSGSLLAFNTELERVFAPQLFAAPQQGVAPLDLATLAERAQAIVPDRRVGSVLYAEPDQVLVNFAHPIDRATGKPGPVTGFDQLFLDPWTGQELGRRTRGDISEGLVNLMPFIYKLHWTLVLGTLGSFTLGIVAIAWTIDCFVGFYLTLPNSLGGFFRRWKTAWLVKWRGGTYRVNFDLHRASGLWLWPMLFVFAWSSVLFNMKPVYFWVTEKIFDYQSPMVILKEVMARGVNDAPALDWRAARANGKRLAAELAKERGFRIVAPLGLAYSSMGGVYSYEIRTDRDVFERSPKGGGTVIAFDGNDGSLVRLRLPTGEHAGNTVESWLYALHMTRVFGRPFQIFVCALGLFVTLLSVTGVYIWLKKRRARKLSTNRSAVRSNGKELRLESDASNPAATGHSR